MKRNLVLQREDKKGLSVNELYATLLDQIRLDNVINHSSRKT